MRGVRGSFRKAAIFALLAALAGAASARQNKRAQTAGQNPGRPENVAGETAKMAAPRTTSDGESFGSLELSRPVRPWEFLPALGMRAGLLGNEAGRMEAWVYPLKICRDLRLKIHVGGRVLAADDLARTLVTRPESSTIVYTGDTFSVRETFFVPVKEPGAVILVDVETETPIEIEAAFHRDFELEWPAALGATYINWEPALRGFLFGEEQRKFAAVVGSPTGEYASEEFEDNFSQYHEDSFRLGVVAKGKARQVIAIAGSLSGRADAESTYRKLSAGYLDMLRDAAEYYRNYLKQTVGVELPDEQLQKAYDWARVSVLQGVVTNPYLGTGLVAGYRTSGESQRPGFAWYFGRDSFWTSFALNAEGDFSNTRTALEFVSKFQREDGKIPHEISQGADFVDWFKGYPYPYASADATPLFIIAANDYVTSSGDAGFAKEQWERLWKAYQFLKSTYDARGLPQNQGVGHGWVEGGPLLPVKTEFYQSGLGAEAVRALANLAHAAGRDDAAQALQKEFERQKPLVNDSFWIRDKKRFAFALDKNDTPVDQLSVLTTVPMWFGLPSEAQGVSTIQQLAAAEIQTDWGTRIISNRASMYSGGGYHYGSVWPLFTGWASVAEYKYHQTFPAYLNLRANALLALDGSLGHVAEVLSGDYYQPLSTNSPHQIWSAAMVVSPVLKGMFGLEKDAAKKSLKFVPHVPADWTDFKIRNVRVGDSRVDLSYHKTLGEMTLEVTREGGACTLDFAPELPNSALNVRVEVNGRQQSFDQIISLEHHHASIKVALEEGKNVVRVRMANDFGLSYASRLPELGSESQGLRVLSKEMSDLAAPMALDLEGRAGATYELEVWNPALIDAVEGAELVKDARSEGVLRIHFAGNPGDGYVRQKVVIHLHQQKLPRKKNASE